MRSISKQVVHVTRGAVRRGWSRMGTDSGMYVQVQVGGTCGFLSWKKATVLWEAAEGDVKVEGEIQIQIQAHGVKRW
jgi:hypothetical protein